MTDERSPWARPPAGHADDVVGVPAYPSKPAAVPVAGPAQVTAAPGYRTGTVTLPATPGPGRLDPLSHGVPELPDPARRNRRMLAWFGTGAGAIVVIGLVVLFGAVLTGNSGALGRRAAPADNRPALAKLCPPPTADPGSRAEVPATPPGPRTVDENSGISFQAYPAPWRPWYDVWSMGTLHVTYRIGQYIVTENYTNRLGESSSYLASILSGSVPVAENDAMTIDLVCTGHQVVADVRASYYPQPNTVEAISDTQTLLGGRPAWVSTFRMHFDEKGLTAKDELVGVALIDVGRPEAAVLYVSIPGTHRQYDHVVDEVLNSVRPI